MAIKEIISILPSQNIKRDVEWYEHYTGFKSKFHDDMYAVLYREPYHIHLQWHADTPEDPLLGGSVIRIKVDAIDLWFEEFIKRKTIKEEKLRRNTPWGTHEFGFYDLNMNGIFIVEGL